MSSADAFKQKQKQKVVAGSSVDSPDARTDQILSTAAPELAIKPIPNIEISMRNLNPIDTHGE